MPTPWSDETERRLLLAIIHLTMPKLPNWDDVAVLMGPEFTGSASRQHFQKMRNEYKERFGEPGKLPEGTPSKGHPRTKYVATRWAPARPAATPGKTTKTAEGKGSTGKRKGKAVSEDMDDSEEEGPAKKKVVKDEDDDEE